MITLDMVVTTFVRNSFTISKLAVDNNFHVDRGFIFAEAVV